MTTDTDNARRIWGLCLGCARAIWGMRRPTDGYALRTARLMFGTAAQESSLRWERQEGPMFSGRVGGFSKWQLEVGSIQESLAYLRRRRDVMERATTWLFADDDAGPEWLQMGIESILWSLRMNDNDVPGVMFCRLHYLWSTTEPIPEGIEGQARYWKLWYNSLAGKGTEAEYVRNWERAVGLVATLTNTDGHGQAPTGMNRILDG